MLKLIPRWGDTIVLKGVKLGELWCLMPLLSCFIGGVYWENRRPAASLTNFIRNGVSSNKGVLIADIYIRTTVYINLKNIPPREPRGIEIGPSFSAEGYNPPKKSQLGV